MSQLQRDLSKGHELTTTHRTNELSLAGSETEITFLGFAKELGWEETHELAEIIQMIPFSGERKSAGVVVRLRSSRYRLFGWYECDLSMFRVLDISLPDLRGPEVKCRILLVAYTLTMECIFRFRSIAFGACPHRKHKQRFHLSHQSWHRTHHRHHLRQREIHL